MRMHLQTRLFSGLICGALMALLAGAALAQDAAAPAVAAPAVAPIPAAPAPMAAPAAEEESQEPEKLAHDMSVTGMFMQADIIVKSVMLGLLLASIGTWGVLFQKSVFFAGLNTGTDKFLNDFRNSKSLNDLYERAKSSAGNPLADMTSAALQEIELSRQAGVPMTGEFRDRLMERATSSMTGVQGELVKRLSGGQLFLASTGSTGPFVGLFGTVWGIMNSFIGIANTGTTNLAVVAPGIAEALLATAIGLVAAIPAVVFYNLFSKKISDYGTRSEAFSSELINAISRQLDRGA